MRLELGIGRAIAFLLLFANTSFAAVSRVRSSSVNDLNSTRAGMNIYPRAPPIGPGPNCTAITSHTGTTANITILGPNGAIIGGKSDIQLPKKGWFNLDSALPWTLAMKLQKHNVLLLQYSNDEPWTVEPQKTSRKLFDCRQFKFWLITNFWAFEEKSYWKQGTLNWTMRALDGTKLGGSPQTDLFAQSEGAEFPAASLTSMLDEVVDVYWSMKNAMTFKYGSQTISLSNATGAHATMLIGSAPMNVFTWTTSGILK